MNRARIADSIVQSTGTKWLFLSGVVLGLAGNLAISGIGPRPLPRNWLHLLCSAIAFVFSSAMFTWIGWMEQGLDRLAQTYPNTERIEAKRRLVEAALPRFGLIAAGAVVSILVGAFLVAFQGNA